MSPENPALSDRSATELVPAFVRALGYSGLERPYEGLSQISENLAGKQVLPALKLVDAPAQATTTEAHVGQLAGNLIGGALPYLLLARAAGAGAAGQLAMESRVQLTSRTAMPMFVKSAASGAIFSMAFDPVSAGDKNHFWQTKIATAASTAASLTLMAGLQVKLRATDLPLFRHEAITGAAAGLPAGLVSANLNSELSKGHLATVSEDVQAGMGMALSGGIMGGASSLYGSFRPLAGINGVNSYHDLLRLNNASVKVKGEPAPFYHVVSEVDSPVSIKETLDGQIRFLPPASREIITASAADLTASHEAVKSIGPRVAIFGSARLGEDSFAYQRTRWLSSRLASMGYTVIDGGGPGIMEAASRGAFEAGGTAVGVRAELPFWEPPNKYVDIATLHRDISSRIEALAKLPDAFIVETGGLGTDLEALFVLQLMQMKHLANKPFYFVDVGQGTSIDGLLASQVRQGLMRPEDRTLYNITGNVQSIVDQLGHYKTDVLDPQYLTRRQELSSYLAPALPRRHTVARVTSSDGAYTFGDFLTASPEQLAAIQPLGSVH